MKITLSRDEIIEILQNEAKHIGEKCCGTGQSVLSILVPLMSYNEIITIEIGVPPTAKKETAE